MEESAVLADKVAQGDDYATQFLWESIRPACQRCRELRDLTDDHVKRLLEAVLGAWRNGDDPVAHYEKQKRLQTITFPEYFIRLMIAAHDG
jgi:hypothetical protein